jgi:hypothetical protein
VLVIVALEGLLAPLVSLSEKPELLDPPYGALRLFFLIVLATLPATAVLLLFVHGRFLLWTGRILKGTARPVELHAAFAWSQLPFVLVAWPLLPELPLRAAAADLDPVPAGLALAIDLASSVRPPLEWIAAVTALACAVRWIQFLAEAQRFSAWRAVANQLLAGVLFVALFGGAAGGAAALAPDGQGFRYGLAGATLALLAVALAGLMDRARSRRPEAA